MITKEIYGENKFASYSKERTGCRGILLKDSRILLVHELKNDFFMIPGGGLEEEESLEACCVRELQEETGYIVKTSRDGAYLQINEYYEDYKYIDYYYLCEIIGESSTNLTEMEAERKLVAEWVDFDAALEIFSRHQEYASTYEEKRGAYLREFTALQLL